MNNSKKIAFVLGLIGFVVLFIWMIEYSGGPNDGSQKPVFTSSNWDRKYQLNDKDPYGLYLFDTLLTKHIDKQHAIHRVYEWTQFDTLRRKNERSTYLFIGHELELLNEEIDTLLSDVNQGSDLVLSFYDLSENVYTRIFKSISFEYDYAESMTVFAGKKKYVLHNIFQTDTVATVWEAFGKFELQDSTYSILSSFMEMPNYIKIPHGKGAIYLHANPQFFVNYQVLEKDGFHYTNYFIDQLPKNQNVYWLEIARKANNYGNSDTDDKTGHEGKQDDSYFKLLFKHPSLMLAMLMVLLGFFLYLLFRAKRMRPVVPYIEKKKNMTLSFAETITAIYFAKQSPKGLLSVQRKNFYNTVQKHFFVDLARREGDREIKILSEKSNIPMEELLEFIQQLENKRANHVDHTYISEIARKQREFYQKTGIISQMIRQRLEKHEKQYNRTLWLPTLLILGGIYIILLGFYYLVTSRGIGIVLWPIGIAWLTMGILRLRKPLMSVTKEKMTVYSTVGKSKTYLLDELSSVKSTSTLVHFYFTENRTVKINYWEMSRFDKQQFERYVSNLHTLEL